MEAADIPVVDGLAQSWQVSTLDECDWALSRLADLEREIAEVEAIAAKRIAEIKGRAQALTEKARKDAEFFRSRVEVFAESRQKELLGTGKKKSRALLHGVLSWRKVGGGLVVADPDRLLAWAQAQPIESGVLRISEAPDLKAIKARHEKDGVIPDGMDLSEERDELTIKAVSSEADHGDQ
jgi:phage host-nuclease inhibitor protein Gam